MTAKAYLNSCDDASLSTFCRNGAFRNIPGLPPEIQRVAMAARLSDGAKTDKSAALVSHFISGGLKVDRVSSLQLSAR
jgi:hypothetical protein